MLNYEVTLNIFLLAIVLGFAVLIGFALRAKLIQKARAKIEELEKEIMNNYELILELERESLSMENRMQDIKSPVISIKKPNKEVEVTAKKNSPDISLRKQLLTKKNIGQQSAGGL